MMSCLDTETKARVQDVAAQMSTFEYYYAVSLAEMVLRHTDNLSETLQKGNISSAQGQEVAGLVKRTLHTVKKVKYKAL